MVFKSNVPRSEVLSNSFSLELNKDASCNSMVICLLLLSPSHTSYVALIPNIPQQTVLSHIHTPECGGVILWKRPRMSNPKMSNPKMSKGVLIRTN